MTNLINDIMSELNTHRIAKNFKVGDSVNVHVKIAEGEKERIQIFKGIVIKTQGSGFNKNFTVRKFSDGIGVERTFPLSSPSVTKIEVVSHGKIRRSKLFYLRKLRGRAAKVTSTYSFGSESNNK